MIACSTTQLKAIAKRCAIKKKPYSAICRSFELSAFRSQWYDMTEPERKEFNQIYKQNNENA